MKGDVHVFYLVRSNGVKVPLLHNGRNFGFSTEEARDHFKLGLLSFSNPSLKIEKVQPEPGMIIYPDVLPRLTDWKKVVTQLAYAMEGQR